MGWTEKQARSRFYDEARPVIEGLHEKFMELFDTAFDEDESLPDEVCEMGAELHGCFDGFLQALYFLELYEKAG